VYNESYAFLVGYAEDEAPPAGWVKVPHDEERGGEWERVPDDTFHGRPYYRQRLPDPDITPENFTVRVGDHWAATMQTREYAKVAFFTGFRGDLPPFLRPIVPYRLIWELVLGATETYVGGLAHESFHAYQGMEVPERLALAEFAARLEGRYPWDDEAAEDAWAAELEALHGAVKASSGEEAAELAREFLSRRDERRTGHGLSGELTSYERQREWLEGLAKYAELVIQRQAGRDDDYEPVAAIHDDPDFNAYRGRERYWNQQVDEIKRMAGRDGETRFYYSGFAQAVLLDRLMPNWKERMWSEGVWLENLLGEAVQGKTRQ
jgi:hypothetical protein